MDFSGVDLTNFEMPLEAEAKIAGQLCGGMKLSTTVGREPTVSPGCRPLIGGPVAPPSGRTGPRQGCPARRRRSRS